MVSREVILAVEVAVEVEVGVVDEEGAVAEKEVLRPNPASLQACLMAASVLTAISSILQAPTTRDHPKDNSPFSSNNPLLKDSRCLSNPACQVNRWFSPTCSRNSQMASNLAVKDHASLVPIVSPGTMAKASATSTTLSNPLPVFKPCLQRSNSSHLVSKLPRVAKEALVTNSSKASATW